MEFIGYSKKITQEEAEKIRLDSLDGLSSKTKRHINNCMFIGKSLPTQPQDK